MKRIFAVMAFLTVLPVSVAWGQHVLTNKDILDMAKAKLSDTVIIDEIQKSKCEFSTTPDDLIALKKDGVSDAVIAAMTEAGSAPSGHAVPVARGAARDIGVYYKHEGAWTTVPPEVVDWKTGGVLKSHFTLGVVKGDINGEIHGGHSQTTITIPASFLVVVPEGAYITEYQLIHLHDHKSGREFRTVTGGVFHVSGGAMRDAIPFESQKVGDRTFEVTLHGLARGDYGFLPAASSPTRQEMATVGAMYTFRVVE
jgi:hypothetical protein